MTMDLPGWARVVLQSAIVYLAILGGLRLAGKRHAGQISPHDIVLVMLVANAVQNAMLAGDETLWGGLIAAATLIVLNVFITRFMLHHRRWSGLVAGKPTLLVHNGQPIEENLRHECILLEELEAKVRAHGFEGLVDVKTAIHEVDGTISVIGFGSHREHRLPPAGRRRRNHHLHERRPQD
jgi:uncharacterized membrane protein YcaP (DUF421 family)